MKWLLCVAMSGISFASELVPGDVITLKMRGVKAAEQEIDGQYTVDEEGMIRLPLLEHPRQAAGMSPVSFARAAEAAYREAAIEVVANKSIEAEGAVLSVGGQVRRNSQVPFRQGMTMLQAIDAAGGRNEFASRNIMLIRDGKQYCLDFENLLHKNIRLKADDSLQVQQKPALFDRWKGTEEEVKPLL